MKNIRKDVAEANGIAEFMGKEIHFTDIYVTKFDENGIGLTHNSLGEQSDEV
jgi:hypothetical protein